MVWEGVGWIHLGHNRAGWLAVVSTVTNMWFP